MVAHALGAEQENEVEAFEFRPLVWEFAMCVRQRVPVMPESITHESGIGVGSIGHDETAHVLIVGTM
jgi:hypothetical protein